MSDFVWISTAPADPRNLRPLRHSFSETEQHSFGIECGRKNKIGDPLGPDCFPTEIYGAPNAKESSYSLPDIFYAGSYWVVSKATADVIRQFDLGNGGLYPVRVLKKDRETLVDGEWYCINFGNRKETFLPDESLNANIRYIRDGLKGWFARAALKDNDFAVSSVAQEGPDIWIEYWVGDAIFFSQALGNALRKAKAAKGFSFKKCRVIRP